MLKMNNLKPGRGARRSKDRIGRGQGSGTGCTAGKGHKGDKSRSGSRFKAYFEGGQTPMTRRIPKRGFDSPFRKVYQIVNVKDLASIENQDREIDAQVLFESGLIHRADKPVKVLGMGEIEKAITVKADAYSKSARQKLKNANATLR